MVIQIVDEDNIVIKTLTARSDEYLLTHLVENAVFTMSHVAGVIGVVIPQSEWID